jgi:sec-independent protein translocase protein TatC
MALVPFPAQQSGALKVPPDEEDDSSSGSMSFLEHLDELRKRILYSCFGVLAGVCASFAFIGKIYTFLMTPAVNALPAGSKLIYTQPGEAFSLYIYISLISGAVLAAPFIMYQVWLFIAPGLYTNEKKLAIPFVLFSTLGFLGGAAFNHLVAFPFIMVFFASFNTPDLTFMPKLSDVFGLYSKMLLGLGVVFQMPAIVFFLAKMELVTARFLVTRFRYALLIFFVTAAIVTPTGDPVNLMIFTAPMLALYGVSIVIAWLVTLGGRGRRNVQSAKPERTQ